MKTRVLLETAIALTFATLLRGGSALPTNLELRDTGRITLPTACKRFEAAPNNVSYEMSTSWQAVDAEATALTSSILAWRDGNDTPFLVNPVLAPGLDILLLGFRVVDGIVEATSGVHFAKNTALIADPNTADLVGPFRVDLGAAAAPNVVKGSPPTQIRVEAKRGDKVGLGVIEIADCVPS